MFFQKHLTGRIQVVIEDAEGCMFFISDEIYDDLILTETLYIPVIVGPTM